MDTAKIEIARNVAAVVGRKHHSSLPLLVTGMVRILIALPWVHPTNSTLLLIGNVTVGIIALFFVILFLIYSDRNKRLKVGLVVLLELILVVVLTVIVLTLLQRRSLAVGIIGSVTSIMVYASALSVMKRVIRTKSVEDMPLSYSLVSFVGSCAWTCYGLFPFNPFICFTNGFGTLLGLGQLILYAIYYKSTKRQMEARQTVEGESRAELGGGQKRTSPQP
ncbi:hypothetical protein SLEP1_g40293 [Rubroshorea leprosula]|uniref:Bidirectional sugar transporter SWEET n=1 Tax=Rubroshorea leprosula TaxID=152421 RepID=A0AAV5L387_9ROSI|nr:hypothetical protein SLEP1_g40293 [Rubroshorea leprosula]